MARTWVYRDDLDQSEDGVETYHFAFGKKDEMVTWEVDLSPDNFQRLQDALQPFTTVAREPDEQAKAVPAGRVRGKGVRANNYPVYDRSAFKEWARKNKVTVPERGRPKLEDVRSFVASQQPA